jgi:hypothetical protein
VWDGDWEAVIRKSVIVVLVAIVFGLVVPTLLARLVLLAGCKPGDASGGPINAFSYCFLLMLPPLSLLVGAMVAYRMLGGTFRVFRRRVPPGHCPKCRCDLAGNVSGVCPECGTPVERPPSAD